MQVETYFHFPRSNLKSINKNVRLNEAVFVVQIENSKAILGRAQTVEAVSERIHIFSLRNEKKVARKCKRVKARKVRADTC